MKEVILSVPFAPFPNSKIAFLQIFSWLKQIKLMYINKKAYLVARLKPLKKVSYH